nr:YccF domain-containing protein [Sporosarcina jiandibaonis]
MVGDSEQRIPEGEQIEDEVLEIPTSSGQINLGFIITIIVIVIAIIFVIMILKKRKISIEILKMPSYSFQPFGQNKRERIKNQDVNLLSTTNVVCLAFQ